MQHPSQGVAEGRVETQRRGEEALSEHAPPCWRTTMYADQARARHTSTCRCVKLDDNSTGGPIAIQCSVGRGGVNRTDDVRTIQDALNRMGPLRSGPVPPLDVDGFIGPKTIGAIEKFQREQCGFAWPDGRVDPGQK